jgi:hypothetical protein
VLKALDTRGLKMPSICVHSFVSDPQPSHDPGLPEAIRQLAGRETLDRLGYKGPVSLRPYQVKGDLEENLGRSMAAWKKYSAEW